MTRLRYNGLSATLGADLLAADTSVTFAAALASAAGAVPTIAAGDYLALSILDASGNVAEIVHLTAYTTGATSGTIARAQEGTTAADAASGASVAHSATVDDFAASGNVGARVYRAGTAMNLPNATVTTVVFDGESYDSGVLHDTAVNPSRITVPAGTYLVVGQVGIAPAANSNACQIRINKTGVNMTLRADSLSTAGKDLNISDIITANDGDYFEIAIYQASGSTISGGILSSTVETFMCVTRLA